jgi:hypothetical protein
MITINTTHNLKIVPITAFAPGTPPALNIFMAYQMAQGSQPGSAILINTPYYYPSSTATFESVLKPPVQPVYDANYAALVGIDAPNGLITYAIRL